MLYNPKHENKVGRLEDEFRFAPELTCELISAVIADAHTDLPARDNATKVARLDQMIQAGAWSDAALALIQLKLPAWKLRRLVYEDGEWLCSLSTQPNLPAELDETADGSHDVMPMAILNAFLEARRRSNSERQNVSPTVPQVQPTSDHVMCCDNFA